MDDNSIGNLKTVVGQENKKSSLSDAESEDMNISIGDMPTANADGTTPIGRIDRYELVEQLGGGGFGAVYRAVDTVAQIDVAVKVLPPMISAVPDELKNVRANFALVQKLKHPNIASLEHLHKVDNPDAASQKLLRVFPGSFLVVMEYVPGSTLSNWRKQFTDKKVPLDKAVDICAKIAEALDFAHGEKVIHRDIKPSNIMITPGGKVKVLDFGLAAEIRGTMSRVSDEQYDTSGTRPYMAPEQWTGKKQDAHTDQYSLACLFYELVSGAVPFASVFYTGDTMIMCNTIENRMPEPIAELTKKQNAALLRALSKNPADRFANCADFIASVRADSISAHSSSRNAGFHIRPFMIIVLILLTGGGIWFAYDRYKEGEALRVEQFRKEQMAKATREKIKNLIGKTKLSMNSGNIADARRSVSEILALDSTNSYAKEMQKKLSNSAGVAEVLSVKNRAKIVKKDAESANCANLAADTWKKAERFYQDANAKLADADFANASKGFALAEKEYRHAKKYAEGISAVNIVKKDYDRLLSSANFADLASYGGSEWAEAKLAASDAQSALNSEDWSTAVTKYKQATLLMAEAIRKARSGAELAEKQKAANLAAAKAIKEASAKFATAKNTAYSDAQRFKAAKAALKDLTELSDQADLSDLISSADKQKIANLKAEIAKLALTLKPPTPQQGSSWTLPDLGIEFVWVKPGTFQMGAVSGYSNEKPVHKVSISNPFWIDKYEVTQKEYKAIMNANPSYFKGDNRPVERVSWNNAVEFCKKLTAREREAGRLPAGWEYRLPTEAEWEYAARGGSKSRGFKYSGSNDIDGVAWYDKNSGNKTHPAGQKKPNELGIYDMSGNVWEWCSDKWHDSYQGAPAGGSSWDSGHYRVNRGGCCCNRAEYCRSAYRNYYIPSQPYNALGFRVCLVEK